MTTSRQWVATDFGGPEVLQLRDVDVPPPGPGEVTIAIRAAGMNPADFEHFGPGQDRSLLPLAIGYEAAGVIRSMGADTQIATGGGAPGHEVIAGIGDRAPEPWRERRLLSTSRPGRGA